MCGGGGGFLGGISDAVNTVVDTVSQPVENLVSAGEKLVTDPTKLTLGDAVSLSVPIAGGLVRDAIDNPSHAVVQGAVVLGGGLATGGFASAGTSAIGADGFATGAAHVSVAPALTPINASLGLAPLAEAGAAGGGSSFLSTLGATSLATTLTGLGQKAQGLIAAIPGATSWLPGIAQTAHAAEAPGGFTAALGANEAAPAATPNDTLRSTLIGAAVIVIPLGGVAYFGWRAYKRWKA